MKKTLLLLALTLTMVFSLFSCNIFGGKEDQPDDDPVEIENLIYNKESELYIVYNPEEFKDEDISKITDAFFNLDIQPRAWSPSELPKPHEIVIGNVGREISNTAYQRLERMEKNSDDDGRYVIYSDGSSVAIAYDYEYGDFTRTIAINNFLENYVSEQLVLPQGEAAKDCFNLPDYLGEQDQKYFDARWKNLEETLGADGAEVVEAFKSYYTLYDGEAILRWLVSLYDPSICVCHALEGAEECKKTKYCGGAGFYYAKSGRDNIGFAPDAESCAQALSIIGNCGITYGLRGGGYASVLPEEVGQKICDYIYSLQEKDGFFYHPQWGENITLNRRGRDYSWCTGILKTYSRPMNYANPSSYSYDSDKALPGLLGNTSVMAVSKVIAANEEDSSPHLATLEAFKEYVASLDIANNSYPAGNTLSAQSKQIYAEGKEYEQVVFDELDRVYRMYDNGTFHHTVNVYAINGVMKCIGWYERMGQPIPDAYKTAMACFEGIGTEEPIKDIVDIWNPWVAFNRVMSNIETCTPNGKEYVANLKAELYLQYAEAIRDTRDKLVMFKKEDGSFSYMKDRTSTTSQGAHVSMANINEGDVNATVIGTNNFTYELFTLVEPMGIGRIPFALTRERYIFYKLLNDVQPIRKEGTNADIGEPLDFDYDEVGYAPNEVTVKYDASEHEDGKGASVIEDPREGVDGNVMKYVSLPGLAGEFTFKANGIFKNATCQVFDADLCFNKVNGNNLIRLEFGNGSDNSNNYRMLVASAGNSIKLIEIPAREGVGVHKTVDLGLSAKKGEWFNLRVEYYAGDHNTVRIKIYFNDKLAVVTDNYYNYNSSKFIDGTGNPNNVFKACRIYMLKDSDAEILCDNVHVYNNKNKYEVEALHEDFEKGGKGLNVDRRLLVEEGIEIGKRMPTMDLENSMVQGETLSTLDLINKPVLIYHFNNASKSDLAKINQLLNEYDGKMSVYAVCSTDFVHSIAGFINTNTALSDTKINFVNDVRAEGADTDTYYKLIGGSGADRRIMIINKDGKVAYSTDAAYDYDTIKAELDKLFAN